MPKPALVPTPRRPVVPRARAAAGLLLVAALAIAACGRDAPGNTLGGSIAEAKYDLSFDRVDIASDGKALSIRYSKSNGIFPCKVTVTSGDGIDLAAGKGLEIDYDRLKNVVTLERQMSPAAKDGAKFPDIARGAVIFDQVSVTRGQPVRGTFQIYFFGDESASIRDGLILAGKFDGVVGG